jgi:hypothetical protein
MRCELCPEIATVQWLGKFTDPPGTEHWYCAEHAPSGIGPMIELKPEDPPHA